MIRYYNRRFLYKKSNEWNECVRACMCVCGCVSAFVELVKYTDTHIVCLLQTDSVVWMRDTTHECEYERTKERNTTHSAVGNNLLFASKKERRKKVISFLIVIQMPSKHTINLNIFATKIILNYYFLN